MLLGGNEELHPVDQERGRRGVPEERIETFVESLPGILPVRQVVAASSASSRRAARWSSFRSTESRGSTRRVAAGPSADELRITLTGNPMPDMTQRRRRVERGKTWTQETKGEALARGSEGTWNAQGAFKPNILAAARFTGLGGFAAAGGSCGIGWGSSARIARTSPASARSC